jgi:hypothetical protein
MSLCTDIVSACINEIYKAYELGREGPLNKHPEWYVHLANHELIITPRSFISCQKLHGLFALQQRPTLHPKDDIIYLWRYKQAIET